MAAYRMTTARTYPGFGLVLAALLIAPLLGLAAALGPLPVIGVVAMLSAMALVAVRHFALWVLAVGALGVAGLVELYLPGLARINWVLVVLSIVLAAGAVIDHGLRAAARALPLAQPYAPGSLIVPLAALYFALTAGASLLEGRGILAALVGLKGYFQIWGLWVAMYASQMSLASAARFVSWLLPLAIVQWPVVLHQYLVLYPRRLAMEASIKNLVAIDVVSGTLGGEMLGGGRSPSLVILSMAGLSLAIMRYRCGRTQSLARTLLWCLLCVGPLAFSEVKIIFVLLPVTLFVLFKDQVLRRPFSVLLGTIVTGAVLVGLLFLYSGMIATKGQGTLVQRYIQTTLGYNFGVAGHGSAALNRLRVYGFWWQEHMHGEDLRGALLGHGAGTTNPISLVGRGSLAGKDYSGYGLGLTGISALLWEVGLVGTMVMLGIFAASYRAARHLAWETRMRQFRPELVTAQVLLLLLAIAMLHNNLLLIDLATQTLLAIAIGVVLVARRHVETAGAAVSPVPAAGVSGAWRR